MYAGEKHGGLFYSCMHVATQYNQYKQRIIECLKHIIFTILTSIFLEPNKGLKLEKMISDQLQVRQGLKFLNKHAKDPSKVDLLKMAKWSLSF